MSILQAPLAVIDKPSISLCAVAQDSGTAYRVKERAEVPGRREPGCPSEENVSG